VSVSESEAVRLAGLLEDARKYRKSIDPFAASGHIESVQEGYALQDAWVSQRLRDGDRIAGYKVAFSNPRVREQLGVEEPVAGVLLSSCGRAAKNGSPVAVPIGGLLKPMAEGELLFRMKAPLMGPNATRQQALEATDSIAIALEIPDSRSGSWTLAAADVSADNACAGLFAYGAFSAERLAVDLTAVRIRVTCNGEVVSEGTTADVMGHPSESVAFVANQIARTGQRLEPGQVVLTGSVGLAFDVRTGDTVIVEEDGAPRLTVELCESAAG